MLFIDTVLSGLFFSDDGTCETYTTEKACLTTNSLDQVNKLCAWDSSASTCSFNQDIGSSFYAMLILTAVIAGITIFFDAFFFYMLRKVKNLAEVSIDGYKVNLLCVE